MERLRGVDVVRYVILTSMQARDGTTKREEGVGR